MSLGWELSLRERAPAEGYDGVVLDEEHGLVGAILHTLVNVKLAFPSLAVFHASEVDELHRGKHSAKFKIQNEGEHFAPAPAAWHLMAGLLQSAPMLYPEDLAVGLKESDSVGRALMQGRQIVMLRKGGVYESGGELEIEFRRFFIFPTFVRQDQAILKLEAQDLFVYAASEPRMIPISAYADVTDVIRLETSEQVAAIEPYHVWAPGYVENRLDSRTDYPLYLLIVRVYRLPQPVMIPNHDSYTAGNGWVGMRQTINVAGATAVLDDATQQKSRDEIVRLIRTALPLPSIPED